MVHYLLTSWECDKIRYHNKPICWAYGKEKQHCNVIVLLLWIYTLGCCGVTRASINDKDFFLHFCAIVSTQSWKNEPSWSAAFLLHHPHCQLSSVCRLLIRKGNGRNEQIAFFRFQMEFVNLTGEEEKWVGKKKFHTCEITKICLEIIEKMNIGQKGVVNYTLPEYNCIWGVNHSKMLETDTQIICNWKYVRRIPPEILVHGQITLHKDLCN